MPKARIIRASPQSNSSRTLLVILLAHEVSVDHCQNSTAITRTSSISPLTGGNIIIWNRLLQSDLRLGFPVALREAFLLAILFLSEGHLRS
jgi:hypothetical protein